MAGKQVTLATWSLGWIKGHNMWKYVGLAWLLYPCGKIRTIAQADSNVWKEIEKLKKYMLPTSYLGI